MSMDMRVTRPDSQADRPHGTDALAWFEAPTAWGALRLAVAVGKGGVRHAADAAIALHDCEPLLCGLDTWAGDALDWRWSAARDGERAVAAHLVWRGGQARLACPWPWLRERRAPQGRWTDEVALPAVAASLVAARMHLPADALGALEVGGAVVIAASLLPSWHGVLRADGEADRAPGGAVVVLAGTADATPTAPRFAPGFDAAAALMPHGEPTDPLCELRLSVPHAVSIEALAGWRDGPVGPLGALGTLWLCRSAAADARPLASGRLMPWGDGWALAIEAVADDVGG
jgi:hypothetical protein